MADYLLEVGCEEIPARMVSDAVESLRSTLVQRLEAEGLRPEGSGRALGGPRRLAVLVPGIPARQPDRSERVTGPPVDKAFGPDGTATRAAQGFAQKLGIAVEDLQRVETPKGTCIAGVKETKGSAASEVLARLAPEVLLGLSFPKAMRWGSSEVRFVRPGGLRFSARGRSISAK